MKRSKNSWITGRIYIAPSAYELGLSLMPLSMKIWISPFKR
jgi:hypothetical protein